MPYNIKNMLEDIDKYPFRIIKEIGNFLLLVMKT